MFNVIDKDNDKGYLLRRDSGSEKKEEQWQELSLSY